MGELEADDETLSELSARSRVTDESIDDDEVAGTEESLVVVDAEADESLDNDDVMGTDESLDVVVVDMDNDFVVNRNDDDDGGVTDESRDDADVVVDIDSDFDVVAVVDGSIEVRVDESIDVVVDIDKEFDVGVFDDDNWGAIAVIDSMLELFLLSSSRATPPVSFAACLSLPEPSDLPERPSSPVRRRE